MRIFQLRRDAEIIKDGENFLAINGQILSHGDLNTLGENACNELGRDYVDHRSNGNSGKFKCEKVLTSC